MSINSDFKGGLETLERWFGTERFQVRSMTDPMVAESTAQIGYRNNRSAVGRWLTAMDDSQIATESGLTLVAFTAPFERRRGIYRLRRRSSVIK